MYKDVAKEDLIFLQDSLESSNIQMAVESNNEISESLSIIDDAIRTGNWTDEALDALENLNTEKYGKILKRFSQEELRSSDGILAQAETIIARGSRGTDSENSSSNRERTKRQEQQVETWAKENGLWYNDYQESKDGSLESVIESDGGVFSEKSGSESLVYWMPDGTAVKAIDASHYEGDLQGLFDKIILHNSMFPETSYTVLGFGKDRGGTFRIIVKQTIIRGERPTIDEILKFIDSLGIEKIKGWYYTKDGKRFTDLNYGNIIKVGENKFAVIYCDVEFTREYLNNTQEQDTAHDSFDVQTKNEQTKTPDITQQFTTSEGEVYGFVDKVGNIYLDEDVISPEHPIHEYTHLWDRAVA